MVSFVPWEIAKHHTPKLKQGHQTDRYSPAQKSHETPELLQLAGELQNHKVLDALQKHFKAGDMKAFYATAEKVLQIQSEEIRVICNSKFKFNTKAYLLGAVFSPPASPASSLQ